MITSAFILSVVLPVQISQADHRFSPFAVKATIDTVVIIGIPPSRAAKDYARERIGAHHLNNHIANAKVLRLFDIKSYSALSKPYEKSSYLFYSFALILFFSIGKNYGSNKVLGNQRIHSLCRYG